MNLDTQNDRALSIQQAADFLGISELQMLHLVKSGAVHASNIGLGKTRPRWRILASDLGKYLLSQRHQIVEPAKPKRANKRSSVKDYFVEEDK